MTRARVVSSSLLLGAVTHLLGLQLACDLGCPGENTASDNLPRSEAYDILEVFDEEVGGGIAHIVHNGSLSAELHFHYVKDGAPHRMSYLWNWELINTSP